MFVNYFVTALRAIKKDKQHFFLNVIGLSIGLAAAILMALFAQHELSYDQHQPDSERVYLGYADYTAQGLRVISITSFKVAEKVKNHSQVESIFRLTNAEDIEQGVSNLVEVAGDYQRLNDFYTASANILDFVNLTTVAGDITQALSEPGQLILSEREAIRLFGSNQVVGQILNHANGQYTIGAVFENLPENTHLKFDSLIHMPAKLKQENRGYVYYKLLSGTDISAFAQQLTKESLVLPAWENKQDVKITLVNMENVHFNRNDPAEIKPGTSLTVLQICIGLSIILVIIASVNFINLSVAQSAKRAKEVGVRKALGATKTQLVAQFFTEYFVVVTFAGLIAFSLVEMALPEFNMMMDRELSLHYSSAFMWMSIAVILAVGSLSGLYPAFFIASFSAKRVLSGDLVRGSTAVFVRKLTLCLQSALSIGLIIAAVSLYQQMQLIENLQVGYEKSSRLVIKSLPNETLYKQEHNSLFAAIKNLPGVEQVTAFNIELTGGVRLTLEFFWPNGEKLEGIQPTISTSYYPVETLGLNLLAGRDFSPEFSSDWYHKDEENNRTLSVIVSRRMVELAGYQDLDSVIGLTLTVPGYNNMRAKVVGVIENVKIGSARQQVLPMSLNLGLVNEGITSNLVIKASNVDMVELRKQIEQLVNTELHLSDVNISTLADDYANAHKSERRALDMVTIFSLLAIFLTCLGTLGLASFATLHRQKEVAMRKVLGASRLSIVNLLAREFLLLLVVSVTITYPITFWLVDDWLANFNERIEQTLWVYLIAAAIITVITWLTVASLAFKAANSRPSLILRDE